MKLLIKLVVSLLVILVISVSVIAITLVNFDPNNYKDTIASKVKEETGRNLSINGDINLTLYPWLGINIEGVQLSNTNSFDSTLFLEAKTFKARAKLLPLLRKELEMDTLILHGVKLNLITNAKGENNWDDLVNSKEKKQNANQNLPFAALILGGIDIKNGSIKWNDLQQGVQYNITKTNLNTGELKLGEPIDITASSKISATKPAVSSDIQFEGTLSYEKKGDILILKPILLEADVSGKEIPGGKTRLKLTSAIKINFDEDITKIDSLDLVAFDSNIKGEAEIINLFSGFPKFTSQLSIVGKDLPRLFKIAEIEPLASELNKLPDKKFNLSLLLSVNSKDQDLNIKELVLNAFGNKINLEAYVRSLKSGTPTAKGNLKATGSDLPSLLKVALQFSGKEKKETNRLAKQLSAVPGSFNVETVFDIDPKAGVANISNLSIDALGISVSGELKGKNIQKRSGSMQGNIEIISKKPKSLLTAFGQSDVAEVLKSFNINTKISGNASVINLEPISLNAVFSGKNIPNSPVQLKINSNSVINLKKDSLSLTSLQVSGLGLDVAGNLDVISFKGNPEYKGQISIAPFDLQALLKTLNKKPVNTANKDALKRVAVKTNFVGSTTTFFTKKINMELDKTKLQGDISIKNFDPLVIEFGLGIDDINVDWYLPKEGKSKPVTPETVAIGAATTMPTKELQALNIKGDLAIGQLVISKATLSDITLSMNAEKGLIKLSPVSAKLYGGNYAGEITLDVNGEMPKLDIQSKLDGIETEPLLNDLMGKADLLGIANIDLSLGSKGQDINELRSTLSGKGDIIFNDGLLKGVDIASTLKQIEVMYESKRFGEIKTSGDTQFKSLTATLNINNGIIDNDDLLLTASGFKVNGKGMLINLNDETWKYNMNVIVDHSTATKGDERYNIGGYDILIKCRGKVINKVCLPDIESMIKALFKETTKQKLLDKLGIKIPGSSEEAPKEEAPKEEAPKEEAPKEEKQVDPKDAINELKDAVIEELFDKLF